jgi:hypothetical protein
MRRAGHQAPIRTVNLKSDMPLVREALSRLDQELNRARSEEIVALKIVHGYGSTGTGGEIRIAVQKRLFELFKEGQIAACVFGEDWAKSNEETWRLLQAHPELKQDPDLGRGNPGISIVVFSG